MPLSSLPIPLLAIELLILLFKLHALRNCQLLTVFNTKLMKSSIDIQKRKAYVISVTSKLEFLLLQNWDNL